MNYSNATDTARREFLKFLAASPYVAALGGVAAYLQRNVLAQSTQESTDVITDPAKALNVFDFEEPARRKVMQGHWAYMASGVDDDGTLRANREASSISSCARAACMTPPRSTRMSNCSAQRTTARFISARQAVKNPFSQKAS